VGSSEHDVAPLLVDPPAAPLGIGSPKQEDDGLGLRRHCLDDSTGQLLPTAPSVATRHALADGQHRVQEQYAVPSPQLE
jgi:hypothetical protein